MMYGIIEKPTIAHYDNLFARGAGLSDINIYKPPTSIQRGGSLIGFLGRIIKSSMPFIRSIIMPEIPNFVSNIISDVNSGENIKSSLKKQSIRSAKNIGSRIINRGGGGKRRNIKKKRSQSKSRKVIKKKKNNKRTKKKPAKKTNNCRSKNDIFSSFRI